MSHSQLFPHRTSAQSGIALLAMSLALLAIGVMLAAYLHWWQIDLEKQRIETTRARMAAIHEAITRYSLQHHKLPCPGDPIPDTKAPTRFDDTGKEDEDCAPEDTAHHDQEVSPVWRGVVPLRALHLDVQTGLDGWGNKISYAVTRGLTADNSLPPLKPPPGVLRVNDQNMDNLLAHEGQGRYVIISHGPTGAGAWTPQGVRKPCVSGTLDSHNCDGDSLFIKAPFSLAPGANFYDDIVLSDDVKDRNTTESLAICGARHAFLLPGGGDSDSCAIRNDIWKGGCTVTVAAPGQNVIATGTSVAARIVAAPSIIGGASTTTKAGMASCGCGDDYQVFTPGNGWDDTKTVIVPCPPRVPKGSVCAQTVYQTTTLSACTMK